MEEIAISIQHNVGLRSFFRSNVYSDESVKEELESVTNLFSERNQLASSRPFVEKIYLYNDSDKSICNLYYSMTISEMKQSQEKYNTLYKSYKLV